jgi:hypothetical protein
MKDARCLRSIKTNRLDVDEQNETSGDRRPAPVLHSTQPSISINQFRLGLRSRSSSTFVAHRPLGATYLYTRTHTKEVSPGTKDCARFTPLTDEDQDHHLTLPRSSRSTSTNRSKSEIYRAGVRPAELPNISVDSPLSSSFIVAMLDNRYAFLEFSAHFPLPSRERVAAIYGLVISGPTTADDDCLPCRMSAMPYTVPLSIVRTRSEFYGSPGKNRFSIQIGLISSTVIGNSIFLGVIQLTGGASRYSYMNI